MDIWMAINLMNNMFTHFEKDIVIYIYIYIFSLFGNNILSHIQNEKQLYINELESNSNPLL